MDNEPTKDEILSNEVWISGKEIHRLRKAAIDSGYSRRLESIKIDHSTLELPEINNDYLYHVIQAIAHESQEGLKNIRLFILMPLNGEFVEYSLDCSEADFDKINPKGILQLDQPEMPEEVMDKLDEMMGEEEED